jgi:hypothetical protein
MPLKIISYEDVLKDLAENSAGKKRSLLLGNGFSRSFADKTFSYSSLFDEAKKHFSANILSVFSKVGETNFEKALKLYDDSFWLLGKYGEKISEGPNKDKEQIRKVLIEIISQNHPEDQNIIADAAKEKTFTFLEGFSNIFTTNYDLLLYWILLYKLSTKGSWDDGFRKPNGILEFTGFEEEFCMYYLHGALHLVRQNDMLVKLTWSKDKLKTLITKSISEGTYPVFVAEGTWEKKKVHIESDYYLRQCYDALGKINGVLIVLGHSLHPAYDRHIIDKIADASGIDQVYISLFGDNVERDNADMLTYMSKLPLWQKLVFFKSETVPLV